MLAIGLCFTFRHLSVTQAAVSLSSAESEAKTMTKGCTEALYVKHLLEHQTSRPFKNEVWTDSSSAKVIMQRLGPGRRAQTFGGADFMGPAAGKDRSSCADVLTKTRAASCTRQARWNDGLHLSWWRNCQVSNVHEHHSESLGSESCSNHETPCVRR